MISFLKYIIIFFIIVSSNCLSFTQNINENKQLDVRFLKENGEIIPGKSFFNVLLIKNKSNKEITINVQYNAPKNWDVIGVSHKQITLQAMEDISLPVRVAVSKNAQGGIGYAVVAIITNLKGLILNSEYSFLKVPIKSKVKITTKKTSYYLDHKNLESSFIIKLENEGNTDETINVELIPDKSVDIRGFLNKDRKFDEFQVETNTTKTKKYTINLKKDIDVKKFKLHKVKIVVKTNDSIIKKTIWFKYLDWKYNNFTVNTNTPLNIDLNAFNILSDATASYRGKIYGKILFKNYKKISYSFENINRDNTNNLYINSRLQLELSSKKTSIFIGDYQGTVGQSMFGRGVSITQKFNEKTFATLLATQRLLTKTQNFAGLYSFSLKKPITFELGAAYSKDFNYKKINSLAYSNIITNIFNNHRINLYFAKSKSLSKSYNYDRNGWAYNLDYSSYFNKLRINLRSYYSSPAYTGVNNGKLYLQSLATYNLNKQKQLLVSYVVQRYKPVYYVNNILFDNKYINSTKMYLRYNTSFNNRFLLYTGPIFISQMTNNFYNFSPNQQFATNTLKYELGIKVFESYSNNSLAFSGKYGITNVFDYSTELNGTTVRGNVENLFYPVIELSASFKRKNFNVYVLYFHGPYNLSQQFAYFYSFFYSKSLNVIPSYERFIYKKTLKLIIRGSYISNLAYKSNRANVNTGIYWNAKKGWKLRFLNSTSYQKVYNNSNYNSSQTSTYFEFGISKSFNIQQPRLKFYKYEAVYYKDLNGNRVHDANEPGVASVLTDIQRENPIKDIQDPNYNGEFLSNELLSNSAGVIDYLYMPEGKYKIKFSPQNANIGVFATESVQKTFSINSDTVMHIPFVEKNKLFGKITLNRTKHSALGNIPIDNIKITVEGNSKTYSALTDKDGYFELFIPVSDYYKVWVNNIFQEHFNLRQEYYIVKFNGYKQFEVSFDFDEKERKIAFDENDFLIDEDNWEDKDFSFDDVKVIKQTNLKGEVKDANSLVALHATISIHNTNTQQLISETASSKRTGVYFTSFFAGDNYDITAIAKGYWVYKENLSINQITTFENITHDILLEKIFLDEEIKTENLNFKSESFELSPLAKAELDNILAKLFLNPSIHIEILGHTDNLEALSTDPIELSKNRAAAVAALLVKKGLKESRISIKGMGNSAPKSDEDTNAGRSKNRRVEIRVSAF